MVIARCSVDYIGRLTAHLPPATRLLMVKADGSVSIHADDRAYKPLNWMSPPCRIEEAPGVWRVVNKAGEELRITLATDPGEGFQEGLRVELIDPRVNAWEIRDDETGRVSSGLAFKAMGLKPAPLRGDK